MLSFRKIALVAIGAALVVVAPAVGKSVTGSASADPTARITGGDAPPPIPSIVNTRLVRAEAALGRATADYDENQPAQAVVPIGAALSNTAKSWGAEKYIIKTTPPTPVGDAVGDGTGGAATAYAGPEDTGVAILNAQHDVITTSVNVNGTSVLVQVKKDQLAREGKTLSHEEAAAIADPVLEKYEREGSPYYATAQLWDDGIVDPADTRTIVGLALSASLNAPVTRGPSPVYRM